MQRALNAIADTNFVSEVPRYRTHDEIGRAFRRLATLYPNSVDLRIIGHSLEGKEIYCLEMGNKNSGKKVLWVANAHGEEMRGTEEILHIIRALLSNDFLREVFLQKFHFTVVPTINPDAREFNLRWAKDEINLQEYFLTARRTIADQNGIEADMEWGYPLSLDEERVMRRPEAAALRALMDEERFCLYLDLHGALNVCDLGFWFLVGSGKHNREQTIEFLHLAGLQTGLPLIEREKMENNLCLKLKPGVHTLCTAKEMLKKYGKEPRVVDWFKKERGASSFDYMMLQNPEGQGFVAELPTFYHERYMDMTPSGRRRVDVERRRLENALRRCREVIIPLLDQTLQISQHPILQKCRSDIDAISIPYMQSDLTRLEEEHGASVATLGEIRELEELFEYWGCPGYGRFGVGGVISRLPKEEIEKLAGIYQLCKEKAEQCAEKVKMLGLRELSFTDSVNIQARTCLGLILTYFS